MQSAELPPVPVILALALALRLAVALCFPNVIAPDEIYQFLEPAHRLVFGQGIVPWEYQVGLRNWAIPLALAAPMALMKLWFPNPLAGLALIRLLFCAGSLGIVYTGLRWGERLGGAGGAWIGGLFTAAWPDLWLMAPHTLEEVIAADLLVPAIYLIGTGERRFVPWVALMLGGIFALRVQLAPAVALAGIVLCGRDARRWLTALPVAALPVLAAGLLDWVSWGTPFRSFWLNVYINIHLGVATAVSGVQAPAYYLQMLWLDWRWALPFMVVCAWRAGRDLRLAGGMAVLILLTHSLIAHKEFRYVFPAVALAIPLAGAGLAQLAAAPPSFARPAWRFAGAPLLLGPLLSPWLIFSLVQQVNTFRLFETAAALRPHLVSLQGWDGSFLPMDILFPGDIALTSQTAAGADAIVATLSTGGIPPGFIRRDCVPNNWSPARAPLADICLWTGPATPKPAGPEPPFRLLFPLAARPYLIRDRLAG